MTADERPALFDAVREARLFEHLLDAVGQAVIATDLAGRITYWNRAAERMYGWTAQETLGRDVVEVAPAEPSAQRTAEIMERLVAGAPSWSGELTARHRDGSTFPAQLTVTPIFDDDGVLIGTTGVCTDIRQRRRWEEDLRETNRALLTLIQSSPLAICSFDLEQRVLMWNPAAERMFGWTAEEIVGRPYPLVPRELAEEADSMLLRVIEGSERLTGWETRRLRKDGTLVDVSVAIAPLVGEDGRATGAMVMVADIADRKRAEDTTRRLAAIVEASDDAIISVDIEGRITTWNKGAERMYGWRAEEVMGKPVSILYGDEPEEAERKLHYLLNTVAKKEQVVRRETIRRARDGTPIDVTLTVFPLYDAKGEVIGVSGITHDIRVQKHAERELRRSLRNLQELDAQRRRLLARVVDAQESERRRIAGDIHDDSIQAMSAAAIRLDSLKRRLDDPESRRGIEALQNTVQEAIARLRNLILELRPSGLDRGGLRTALEELLSAAEEDGSHSFELRSTLEEPIPEHPRAIAFRIAQEAIQNVRRHAPGARIEVDLVAREGGIHSLIRDDGPGFDTGRGASGRGHLGLASMRERAEMAGGWLRIEAAPGAGTSVEFWIPTEG